MKKLVKGIDSIEEVQAVEKGKRKMALGEGAEFDT